MNKIAKSVIQGTPVGTGVGMRPETLDLEIDDLYELSSPNVGTYIRRLRPYVSAWEADRKARIEIEQAYSDLQDEHMVLHQELGAAQTRIKALLRLCSDADNAAQVERQRFRARIKALEPLARYGERQLLREYEDEAGIESILSMTRGIPSAHRSFEAFKAERLATLAKESSEDTPMASDHDWSPGDP